MLVGVQISTLGVHMTDSHRGTDGNIWKDGQEGTNDLYHGFKPA
jgi:hypothetical protein